MKLIKVLNSINLDQATIIAADHLFDCNCLPCLAFLTATSLEYYGDAEDDERWVSLRETEVEGPYKIPEETLFALRELIEFYV